MFPFDDVIMTEPLKGHGESGDNFQLLVPKFGEPEVEIPPFVAQI